MCWSSWFSKPCQKSTHMCRLYSEQRRCAAEAEAVIRPDAGLGVCRRAVLGRLASRLEERGTAGAVCAAEEVRGLLWCDRAWLTSA